MNSQARSKYSTILNEDWVKLGYRPLYEPGLTNEIHHLFQYTNASRPKDAPRTWPQLNSKAEYDDMCTQMGPVLQLASNIIQSPKSLDFVYDVVYSPREDGGLDNQGRTCKEFGRKEHPFPAIRRDMAKKALRSVSRSLRFQVADPEANPELQASFAATGFALTNFEGGIKIDEVSSKLGLASKIYLNRNFIVGLKELDTHEGDTTAQKMTLQLKMAITVCHEIAHALDYAVNSELLDIWRLELNASHQAFWEGRKYEPQALDYHEPYYRDETMAEIGIAWENQVFGGQIYWSGHTADPLFVSKWPSFLTLDNHFIPTRSGNGKRTARRYAVSVHFNQNMHRQEFWDGVDPGDDTALHIRKTVGIEYINPDAEASSINSSENNWPSDAGSSRVSREGEWSVKCGSVWCTCKRDSRRTACP